MGLAVKRQDRLPDASSTVNIAVCAGMLEARLPPGMLLLLLVPETRLLLASSSCPLLVSCMQTGPLAGEGSCPDDVADGCAAEGVGGAALPPGAVRTSGMPCR